MQRRGLRIVVAAMTISTAGLHGGCSGSFAGLEEPKAHADGRRSSWLDTPGSAPNRQTDQIVVVHMQFEVLRLELPADPIHHSQKIWNHADELRIDPVQTALLRGNGLRIGAASTDAWPALRAIFEACEAEALSASHTVRQGMPLTLELGEIQSDETVFLLTADHRMVGKTYAGGHR
ncbi:MAG: hypothetical protein ACYSUQ_01610, partial [Planctomycetota bacterium]